MSVIDKIRALRAKAQDEAATPEEASAFAEKCAELMEKYAIEEHELTDRPDHVMNGRSIKYLNPWRRSLATAVGRTCFCEVVFGMGTDFVEVVGRPLNVEAFWEMYDFIERQVLDIAQEMYRGQLKERRTAEAGIGLGVVVKLAEHRAADANSRLPVVQELEEVERATREMYPGLKTETNRGHEITREFVQGARNANRVKLRREFNG